MRALCVLSSLYYQCEGETFESACDDLADVYYEAVKEFGSKRDVPREE